MRGDNILCEFHLNNIWLTNDGRSRFAGAGRTRMSVLLNGRQVVQDAQFLRAVSAQPLARGNAVNLLQFSVTRQHASVAAASAFVLTAFSSLPRERDGVGGLRRDAARRR